MDEINLTATLFILQKGEQMKNEAENQKIDEVLEEILAGQIEDSTYKFAAYTKGFYDNFLKVGFSESLARDMIVTMVGNMTARASMK